MRTLLWIAYAVAACGKPSDRSAGSDAPSPTGPPDSAPGGAVVTGPEDPCEVHDTVADGGHRRDQAARQSERQDVGGVGVLDDRRGAPRGAGDDDAHR